MIVEDNCECCNEIWNKNQLKQGLCPNCYHYFKDIKQQLAEKDNEIEKFNRMLATLPQHDDELRHQICKEIREWCQNDWDYDDFMYFLDKIEKGDEDE